MQSGRPRELPLLLVKVAQKRRASLKSLLKGGNVYLLVCHVPFIANGAGFLLQCTDEKHLCPTVSLSWTFCTLQQGVLSDCLKALF